MLPPDGLGVFHAAIRTLNSNDKTSMVAIECKQKLVDVYTKVRGGFWYRELEHQNHVDETILLSAIVDQTVKVANL